MGSNGRTFSSEMKVNRDISDYGNHEGAYARDSGSSSSSSSSRGGDSDSIPMPSGGPGDSSIKVTSDAQAAYNEAAEAFSKSDYETAREIWTSTVKSGEDDVRMNSWRSMGHLYLNGWGGLNQDYTKAIECWGIHYTDNKWTYIEKYAARSRDARYVFFLIGFAALALAGAFIGGGIGGFAGGLFNKKGIFTVIGRVLGVFLSFSLLGMKSDTYIKRTPTKILLAAFMALALFAGPVKKFAGSIADKIPPGILPKVWPSKAALPAATVTADAER